MADLKISELTNLTAADPANDMIPIVDVSATPPASGSTKRISINNILACSPSATLASATITGDLTVRANKLAVTSTGVGIGTASPLSPLHVFNGNILLSNAYYLSSRNAANTTTINLIGRNASDNVVIDADGYGVLMGAGSALQLNGSGNLGLGVTPSAWNSAAKAFQAGRASIASNGITTWIGSNVFYDSTYTPQYIANEFAGSIVYNPAGFGGWAFNVANAGTGAVAFTQAMTLDASGNLLVGATSGSYRGQFAVAAGADGDILTAQVTSASNGLQVKWNHATTTLRIICANLPTASAGLAAGTLWNDAGTIKIA